MHDLSIIFKGCIVIFFVWFQDVLMINLVSLTILNSDVKSFFIESKEIINWAISLLVLYISWLKLVNEKKGKK